MVKPILFNTDMVRAILEGRKTVTRRLIKPKYREDESGFQVITNAHTGEFVRVEKISEHGSGIFPDGSERYVNPPCWPGDILYVRETWCGPIDGQYVYKATVDTPEAWVWRPSIHMPREAARLFLRVTDVRVERLKDITAAEIAREGVKPKYYKENGCKCVAYTDGCMDEPCPNRDAYEYWSYVVPFAELWNSTIKAADRAIYGCEANPWVWVIEFERTEGGTT